MCVAYTKATNKRHAIIVFKSVLECQGCVKLNSRMLDLQNKHQICRTFFLNVIEKMKYDGRDAILCGVILLSHELMSCFERIDISKDAITFPVLPGTQ